MLQRVWKRLFHHCFIVRWFLFSSFHQSVSGLFQSHFYWLNFEFVCIPYFELMFVVQKIRDNFWKMKQRKSCASDINSSSDECNGHVRSFKRTSKDEFRSRNGNRCRNSQIKSDKPKKACVHGPQMMYNRSQRCLSRNNTVQTSLRNAPIYSKFAFHRIVPLIVILLFIGCYVVNGQQTDSQFNAQNTGEWVISCYFTAVVSTAESNLNE